MSNYLKVSKILRDFMCFMYTGGVPVLHSHSVKEYTKIIPKLLEDAGYSWAEITPIVSSSNTALFTLRNRETGMALVTFYWGEVNKIYFIKNAWRGSEFNASNKLDNEVMDVLLGILWLTLPKSTQEVFRIYLLKEGFEWGNYSSDIDDFFDTFIEEINMAREEAPSQNLVNNCYAGKDYV